jgi:hypothetical protein
MMLDPRELEDTSVRQGYGGKPTDCPVSIWVCFRWRMLTTTLTCRLRISPNGGSVLRNRDGGGGVTSLSSSSSLSEDSGLEGLFSTPPHPDRHLGSTPSLLSLFSHLQLLIMGTVCFLLYRVLR